MILYSNFRNKTYMLSLFVENLLYNQQHWNYLLQSDKVISINLDKNTHCYIKNRMEMLDNSDKPGILIDNPSFFEKDRTFTLLLPSPYYDIDKKLISYNIDVNNCINFIDFIGDLSEIYNMVRPSR